MKYKPRLKFKAEQLNFAFVRRSMPARFKRTPNPDRPLDREWKARNPSRVPF